MITGAIFTQNLYIDYGEYLYQKRPSNPRARTSKSVGSRYAGGCVFSESIYYHLLPIGIFL